MTSIRSYLSTSLLTGFVVVLGLGSFLVYLIAARILASDFDGRLFNRAQAAIASTSQKGDRVDLDWNQLPQESETRGRWIEIVDQSGHLQQGESFLEQEQAVTGTGKAVYFDAVSKHGTPLRVLAIAFTPSVEKEDAAVTPVALRRPCTLLVGNDREPLDHSLRLMAVVLAAMVVLVSALSLMIIRLVLRRGLQPLAVVSSQVAQINELKLEQRIDLDRLPEEILPIAGKLNDLLARLQVSFSRERRFSSDVSHELRTPVAELKTLAEVMLQEGQHSPAVQQAFTDARDIALHMEALVTVLLEIVRQETGQETLALSGVDPEALLTATWKKLEARAAARDIRLKRASLWKKLEIKSEPRLLGMVFANLLDNAIEYSPRGSDVGIEWHMEDEATTLALSNPAGNLIPADLPHLFERFWRKDAARGESGHFGIGLALTRTICQRLGIQLQVSMDEHGLVCFRLHFPHNPHPHPAHERTT